MRTGAGAEMQPVRLESSLKEQAEEMIQARRVLNLAKGAEETGAVVGSFILLTLCLFWGLAPSSQIITQGELILTYKCPPLLSLAYF